MPLISSHLYNTGLQKTLERIEKSHRQDQKGISWEHVWRDHRISKNARCDLIFMKTKGLEWKENCGIQSIDTKDSQENIIVEKGQVLRIWQKYVAEIYGRSGGPEILESNLEREKVQTRKVFILCTV